MRYKKPRTITAALLGGTFLLIIVAGYILIPNDWQDESPRLISRIWTTIPASADKRSFFYITEEERTYRKTIGSHSRRGAPTYRSVPYSVYRLEVRSMANGAPVTAVWALQQDRNKNLPEPEILGVLPDAIWIWHQGLQVHDPVTAELRYSSQAILAQNPQIAQVFPDETDDTKLSDKHQAMIIKTTDLRYFQLDPISGKATPFDEEKLRAVTSYRTAKAGYDRLIPPGQSAYFASIEGILAPSLLGPGQKWYALIGKESVGRTGKWPIMNSKPWGEEWRSLYATPYTRNHRDQPEIDPTAIEQVGNVRLLNAGIMKRNRTERWLVPDPESMLVLFKQNLKKHSAWHIGRLSFNGEMLWQKSTGLADIQTMNDAGDQVLFCGHRDFSEPTNLRPATIVIVDQSTGKLTSTDITPGGKSKPSLNFFGELDLFQDQD